MPQSWLWPVARALMYRFSPLTSAWRRTKLRVQGAEIGRRCRVGSGVGVDISCVRGTKGVVSLSDDVELATGVLLATYGGRVIVGQNTHIGPYSVVYGHGGVVIGAGVLIGPRV